MARSRSPRDRRSRDESKGDERRPRSEKQVAESKPEKHKVEEKQPDAPAVAVVEPSTCSTEAPKEEEKMAEATATETANVDERRPRSEKQVAESKPEKHKVEEKQPDAPAVAVVEPSTCSTEAPKEEEKMAEATATETANVDGDDPLLVDPFLTFTCSMCHFEEKALFNTLSVSDGYYPFPVYYMRDPFSPPIRGKGRKPKLNDFLVLGSSCRICQQPVCFDKACSVYFGAHFCANCILREHRRFPAKVVEMLNQVQEAKKKVDA